ncbi:MAG: Tim44 domain-containing protein [Pseudomonadota bacterium]|nr:Tim44 domain-containing protein [Pseudomonadota bacterium]QKK04991.1 MAG: Tim44 domain-containing protein [Pseudomonadota bacterium]
MTLDIVLFALVAAFLVHRLRSLLGTRHGDERQRPNPFASSSQAHTEEEREKSYEFRAEEDEMQQPSEPVQEQTPPLDTASIIADGLIAKDEELLASLTEIASADASFDVYHFAEGAQYAFDVILDAYADGDLETLEPLLSQKLFEDFETAIRKREKDGLSIELAVKDIKSMQIVAARLAGTMAYITVDYAVEEKQILRDAKGKEVKGKTDAKVKKMHDVWTFARDIRSVDPAWMLIETRAG